MSEETLKEQANEYAKLCGITLDLKTPLGHGTDGSVWRSNRKSAVKALNLNRNYLLERECYQRFKDKKVRKIHDFSVPFLIRSDDSLLVIEMEIVTPPYILDFAKVHLDKAPDFTEEAWEYWDSQGQEMFEGRWPEVQALLSSLKRFGIYYSDPKPGNIMFKDWQDY